MWSDLVLAAPFVAALWDEAAYIRQLPETDTLFLLISVRVGSLSFPDGEATSAEEHGACDTAHRKTATGRAGRLGGRDRIANVSTGSFRGFAASDINEARYELGVHAVADPSRGYRGGRGLLVLRLQLLRTKRQA